MKFIKTVIAVLSIGMLVSLSVFAGPPKVVCEPIYSKNAPNGSNIDYVIGSVIPISLDKTEVALKSFTISASLRQIRASDGGPATLSYSFNVVVSKGSSSSFMGVTIAPNDTSRYSTSLVVDDEKLFVNCDVK